MFLCARQTEPFLSVCLSFVSAGLYKCKGIWALDQILRQGYSSRENVVFQRSTKKTTYDNRAIIIPEFPLYQHFEFLNATEMIHFMVFV